MAEAEREILTWEAFGEGGRELARQIADDGYRPDIILAIARGGLFTAGLLGYALSVKNIYVINVEYYTGSRSACRCRSRSRRRPSWSTSRTPRC